uniref:TNase-like domain-containing protein n=1 Tax=viral metagenome TaxID=1070528 RepID=A0A6C0J2V8_9ZZZZ
MEIDWANLDNTVELFSLEGQEHLAKVVDVYDGDTIKCVFPIHNKLYRWNCRLSGVDTPEIRTRCSIEKKHGYKVRDYLRDKILNRMVYLQCNEFDKYGRLLVNILYDDCIINDWLIQNDYAFQYDGGTKQSWSEYLSL